ncbi:quinoprotein dehydrogenase-associated putative ABC transporter substrate-binding protein [Opitutaceae bacterium EW11]|nr:quinoprotein dehydrogenase-associated putative ABC transporter substrate-binding protein [Opitutaceae bacterium EW11]
MSSLFPDRRLRLLRVIAAGCLLLTGRAFSGELALGAASAELTRGRRVLRVAADPNNLPFSNSRLEGFENKIVALIAQDLGAQVEYTWTPQWRGFFRQTLKEGSCDLIAGVPAGFERTLTTAPYYRSSYTFLSRADRHLGFRTFDDPRLRTLQIGVQMIGDDSSNTPPAHALSARGIVDNVHGYPVYGNYASDAPLAAIVDAVARGEIDVAIVWGPLAGYFAKRYEGVFALDPIADENAGGPLPCTFEICLGVRRSEPGLRDELNQVLSRRRAEIEAILTDYGVPLADASR